MSSRYAILYLGIAAFLSIALAYTAANAHAADACAADRAQHCSAPDLNFIQQERCLMLQREFGRVSAECEAQEFRKELGQRAPASADNSKPIPAGI